MKGRGKLYPPLFSQQTIKARRMFPKSNSCRVPAFSVEYLYWNIIFSKTLSVMLFQVLKNICNPKFLRIALWELNQGFCPGNVSLPFQSLCTPTISKAIHLFSFRNPLYHPDNSHTHQKNAWCFPEILPAIHSWRRHCFGRWAISGTEIRLFVFPTRHIKSPFSVFEKKGHGLCLGSSPGFWQINHKGWDMAFVVFFLADFLGFHGLFCTP